MDSECQGWQMQLKINIIIICRYYSVYVYAERISKEFIIMSLPVKNTLRIKSFAFSNILFNSSV